MSGVPPKSSKYGAEVLVTPKTTQKAESAPLTPPIVTVTVSPLNCVVTGAYHVSIAMPGSLPAGAFNVWRRRMMCECAECRRRNASHTLVASPTKCVIHHCSDDHI